jgi:D-sedoheptulose 7-phosphate isomerase
MLVDSYNKQYLKTFQASDFQSIISDSVSLVGKSNKIFFIGNGGSNSISSHMMEDYGKMGRKKTYAFSDPALITCYANDYGYENSIMEWLKLHIEEGDLLVAISSSGSSKNILNAVKIAKTKKAKILSCSGFEENNPLRKEGDVNFYIDSTSYGIVECFHQIFLHIVLDEFCLKIES